MQSWYSFSVLAWIINWIRMIMRICMSSYIRSPMVCIIIMSNFPTIFVKNRFSIIHLTITSQFYIYYAPCSWSSIHTLSCINILTINYNTYPFTVNFNNLIRSCTLFPIIIISFCLFQSHQVSEANNIIW